MLLYNIITLPCYQESIPGIMFLPDFFHLRALLCVSDHCVTQPLECRDFQSDQQGRFDSAVAK